MNFFFLFGKSRILYFSYWFSMYKIILTDFLVLNQLVLVGSIFFSVVDIIFFMYN